MFSLLGLSVIHMDSRDWTQVLRLGDKHLYMWPTTQAPKPCFLVVLDFLLLLVVHWEAWCCVSKEIKFSEFTSWRDLSKPGDLHAYPSHAWGYDPQLQWTPTCVSPKKPNTDTERPATERDASLAIEVFQLIAFFLELISHSLNSNSNWCNSIFGGMMEISKERK